MRVHRFDEGAEAVDAVVQGLEELLDVHRGPGERGHAGAQHHLQVLEVRPKDHGGHGHHLGHHLVVLGEESDQVRVLPLELGFLENLFFVVPTLLI